MEMELQPLSLIGPQSKAYYQPTHWHTPGPLGHESQSCVNLFIGIFCVFFFLLSIINQKRKYRITLAPLHLCECPWKREMYDLITNKNKKCFQREWMWQSSLSERNLFRCVLAMRKEGLPAFQPEMKYWK